MALRTSRDHSEPVQDNRRPARTRHPDPVALDAAVEIAPVRGSGAAINHLECKIADPLWYRQGRSLGVDHRGWYAVREQSRSTGSEGDELVEVHHAKPSQRIGRAVETAAATDPGVDCDGGREPGIDREVHGLGRCLIRQTEERRTRGIGLQAQRGADGVAGANRDGDLRPGRDHNLGRDVLVVIDRHFHVDVKETEAEEGAEVVWKPRMRAVVQVRYRPGSGEYGDRCAAVAQLKAAGFQRKEPEARGDELWRLLGGKKLGLQVLEILVAARRLLPQRRQFRLRSRIKTLG